MSISNYTDLVTTVGRYLHRSDLNAMIPEFVSLAEAKINRNLRIRAMENIATGNVSASVALPFGFVEVIALTVSQGSATYPLTYISPSQIKSESAPACYYSLVGDNLYFVPASSGQTYTLTYYKKFDPLADGPNWLITNAPDLYLYSVLLEASPYIKNDARIAVWAELMSESVRQIKSSDKRDRFGNGLSVMVS